MAKLAKSVSFDWRIGSSSLPRTYTALHVERLLAFQEDLKSLLPERKSGLLGCMDVGVRSDGDSIEVIVIRRGNENWEPFLSQSPS